MILLAVVLWKMASQGGQTPHEEELGYTSFVGKVQGGDVKDVTIYLSQNSAEIQGTTRENTKFKGVTIANTAIPDITKMLDAKNVNYVYREVNAANWISFLVNLAPFA